MRIVQSRLGASKGAGSGAAKDAHFHPWQYRRGDSLGFESGSVTFIFSEHFFEHLFLDEAAALLRECSRVLSPGGVIRTVVPDADLRRDLPPEPVGFPGPRVRWSEPAKHKTRWSVYSLSELIRNSGLEPMPVRYFDRDGQLHELGADHLLEEYSRWAANAQFRLDREVVGRLDYIQRPNSLIVDGLKPPANP